MKKRFEEDLDEGDESEKDGSKESIDEDANDEDMKEAPNSNWSGLTGAISQLLNKKLDTNQAPILSKNKKVFEALHKLESEDAEIWEKILEWERINKIGHVVPNVE